MGVISRKEGRALFLKKCQEQGYTPDEFIDGWISGKLKDTSGHARLAMLIPLWRKIKNG